MKASALRLGIALLLLGSAPLPTTAQPACAPTPADAEGPFYKAGAPMRESTGKGFVVSGTVFAPGHRALTTQLYPKLGQTEITFDLVVAKQ